MPNVVFQFQSQGATKIAAEMTRIQATLDKLGTSSRGVEGLANALGVSYSSKLQN